MSEETLDRLRAPTFDNWQWEDAEMMFLVQEMFVDLGLVETFHIEVKKMAVILCYIIQYTDGFTSSLCIENNIWWKLKICTITGNCILFI